MNINNFENHLIADSQINSTDEKNFEKLKKSVENLLLSLEYEKNYLHNLMQNINEFQSNNHEFHAERKLKYQEISILFEKIENIMIYAKSAVDQNNNKNNCELMCLEEEIKSLIEISNQKFNDICLFQPK